ncbi:MAG TPA: BON domain-containing protein, partial [Candidatus Binataceae bacterium]|nr:BON domain-containing protein [Candidatus Binataceae bacterium]
LLDAYRHELAADSTLRDGMTVRLHIVADGSVSQSTVRTSTAANPSLDAAIVTAMSGWKFASASGAGVDADFPIIFATNAADEAAIESNLNTKLASLGPNAAPEYPPTAVTAATPGAATPAPSPEVAVLPSTVAPMATPTPARRHRPPPVVASVPPPPKISLLTRVNEQLGANRKLRRVHAYTTGGTVTLYGKVFDDNDKLLAQRTVRHVNGVTGVVNNLTTDTQEWAQNQARIQQELQNAGLTGVTVKVIGSSAYLSGEVKSDLERQRAATIAEATAPVKVRENLIRVAIGSIFSP